MKRFLWFIFLLLIPEYILADTTDGSFTFTPPQGDLSVSFLGDIFGVVTGVLHGTGGQILGTMFGILNSAILSIGSVVVMYVLFVGTLYTAHEGKALGEKWGSLWVPIRMVGGIGAMIPQATGYSFVQIFIMWLVVQGVGAADSIWSGALGYMERGGILVQQTQGLASMGSGATVNPPLAFTAGNILKSETCMYIVHNAFMKQPQKLLGPSQVPDFTSSLQVVGLPSHMSPPCYMNDPRKRCQALAPMIDTQGQVEFPGGALLGYPVQGICGSVTWNLSLANVTLPDGTEVLTSDTAASGNGVGPMGSSGVGLDSRSTAVMQMVLDMQPLAYQLAELQLPTINGQSTDGITSTSFTPSPAQIVDSAADYISIMGPFFNFKNNSSIQNARQTLETAKSQGWLMAGSYYFLLSSLNNAYNQKQGETDIPSSSYPPSFSKNVQLPKIAQDALDAMSTAGTVTSSTCGPKNLMPIDQFICNEYSAAVANTTANNIPAPGVPTANMTLIPNLGSIPGMGGFGGLGPILSTVDDFMNYLPEKFNDLMNEMNNLLNAQQQQNLDPIVAVSAMGIDILDAAEYIWISGAIGAAGIGLLMGALPSASMGTAVTTFVVWIVGFLTVILMAMFETGMVMAYYIPLIPFIIFLFTTLGWFVGVLEAIIAGPLVALGLTSPEGHHQFGAVSHAIMLLMNVFLRPSFIIFGFIAGAIMSHVGLWIMNAGLSVALNAGQTPVNTDMANVLRALALLIVYSTLVLQVINRAFKLIYEIPNTVLQWLSPSANREFGEAAGIEQVTSQVTGKFGALGTTVGEVGKQAMSVGPAIQKALSGKGGAKGGGAGGGEAG